MNRFVRQCLAVSGAAALLCSAVAAHAACAVPTASFEAGPYGASAVTTNGCDLLQANGGTLFTSATASGSFSNENGSFSLSSTADLSKGVLTVYSQGGLASASMWDTFTYTGLPASGAVVTATLSLPGTLTGSSDGIAVIEEGTQSDFTDGTDLVYSQFFNTGAFPKPPSISLSFDVSNGAPVVIYVELFGQGDGSVGVADFGDPPILDVTLPLEASATTASGVFDNFVAASAPEPSTWAMMLIGFAGLSFAGYRAPRRGRARPIS